MIHHRSAKEVKRFDIIKLVILIILIILLMINWFVFAGRGRGEVSTGSPEPLAQATLPNGPEVKLAAPSLAAPSGPLAPGEVTLIGTGSAGSTVAVVIDGKVVGQTEVGSDGAWSLPVELTEAKQYQVSAQALTADGKVAAESQPLRLTVAAPVSVEEEPTATETPAATAEATAQPEVPQIAAPTVAAPADGLTVGPVSLSGTGQANSTLVVLIDGREVGQTQVGSDGTWAFETDLAKAGDYQVQVQSVDDDGKLLAESGQVKLTVSEPVVAPALDAPSASLTTGVTTLSGTGQPGSEVEVVMDGQVVGTATVADDGTWRLEADLPKVGDYQASVQTVGAAGQVLAMSEPIALVVAEPVVAPTLDVPSDPLVAGEVELSGSGGPGDDIVVQIDGQAAGQTTAAESGDWSLKTDLPQAGEYQVNVQAVDADGAVLAESGPVSISVVKPVVAPTVDSPGDSLTPGTVELSGAGEPGSEIEIVIDGKVVGTTTVGEDGQWSLGIDLAKAGDYAVTVRSIDPAGKLIGALEPFRLTIAKAMAVPTLAKLPASLPVGPVDLSGRGEPDSNLVVLVDGKEVGQTQVGSNGRWRFGTDFVEAGDYEIQVQTVEGDGQVLAESAVLAVNVTAEAGDSGEGQATVCTEIYTVQKDDWLTKLALKYYNEMFDYPLIVEATNAKAQEDNTFLTISNPDLIEIGQQLCIPEKP
jgi:hypothetical protein